MERRKVKNGEKSPWGQCLLAVLYFSSFHVYFSARLDFPSPPLSAPGSPGMQSQGTVIDTKHISTSQAQGKHVICFFFDV